MTRTRKPDAKRALLPCMRIRESDASMIRNLAASRGQSLVDLFVALAKPHALPENTQNQPLTQNNGQSTESHG